MRLADHLRDQRDALVAQWVAYAALLAPPDRLLGPDALRDDAAELIDAIADAVDEAEHGPTAGRQPAVQRVNDYAQRHAQTRLAQGFSLRQVVAEYREMRAGALRGWLTAAGTAAPAHSVVAFGQAIDEALAASTVWYEARIARARELFLGMLGHDLRTPVGAIALSVQLLQREPRLTPPAALAAQRIARSTGRLREMLDTLLDFTRSRLDGVLPVRRQHADLGPPLRDTVDELRTLHPATPIDYAEHGGALTGDWDVPRLCQVVQNMGANAVYHGDAGAPVTVRVAAVPDTVTITVHNQGQPIPPDALPLVFDPLARGAAAVAADPHAQRAGLGLGLYICRQIVEAHGGTLGVQSSAADGTRFTARLPRRAA